MIPSRDIVDPRIIKSDWMRRTTGQTQTKVTVIDATFP